MGRSSNIAKFIVLNYFLLWNISQALNYSAISEHESSISRRVKTESPSLLTASEIEQAVEESGGWEGLVVEPDIGEITELWGQNIRSDKKLLIRKKSGCSESFLFARYLVIQLLDEYFVKTGVYSVNHITPALAGSDDGEGVYYINAPGRDGFSWGSYDVYADLEEWDTFSGAFRMAGFLTI